MKLSRYAELAQRLIDWRALRLHREACPLCRFSYLIKLGNNEHAVRCLRCGANPAAMSIARELLQRVVDLANKRVYELSSRGPLFRFLQGHARTFTYSEYFDDVPPGAFKDGVPCQDVQHLSYPAQSFDVCTSTDVFEHVPDDAKGFAELYRVLRPGGCTIFTVPFCAEHKTVERATIVDNRIEHLMPPEYHSDHIRGNYQVLCFRNYGTDIVDRIKEQGFASAVIIPPDTSLWWGYGRHVIVAFR